MKKLNLFIYLPVIFLFATTNVKAQVESPSKFWVVTEFSELNTDTLIIDTTGLDVFQPAIYDFQASMTIPESEFLDSLEVRLIHINSVDTLITLRLPVIQGGIEILDNDIRIRRKNNLLIIQLGSWYMEDEFYRAEADMIHVSGEHSIPKIMSHE